MNVFVKRSLAALVLGTCGLGAASACSISAWTATNTTAVASDAGGRAQGIRRYYGLCGLNATSAGKVVGDNSPAGSTETTYRARFYFFTGISAGEAQIFAASTADNNTGSEVLGLSYQASGNVLVRLNGATASTITGLTASKWYAVEIAYVGGTSVSVTMRGNQTFTNTTTLSTSIPTSGIGSATLGFISSTGATGGFQFDEFDSSRGTTAIDFYPRGNARIDTGTQVYNIFDIIDVAREVQSGVDASGNADAQEDGDVDIFDIIAVARRVQLGSF